MTENQKLTAAIIGSGISGICAFIQLKQQLGIKATVFELNKGTGGTWFKNAYPGCSCDVASHVYSFSFELNPDWPQMFSRREDILQYLETVSRKYDMAKHTYFETKVTSAVWIEKIKKWKLEFKNATLEERVLYFDLVFSAMGTLSVPNIPSELKNFTGGPIIHTYNWDSSIEYKGKRIALVGSGASAVQILPYLAKEAAHLTLYQRNAPWIMPKMISNISERVKYIFRTFPAVMRLYRIILFLVFEALYFTVGYPDCWFAKFFERRVVADAKGAILKTGRKDLIEKLKPTSPLGCKRGSFSADYYQTVARPNVSIVSEEIVSVNGNEIISKNGTKAEFDLLVLGTGFKTNTGIRNDITIIGRQERSLTKLWEQGLPQLYNSTIMHGFPNLFMLAGPYTYLGHNSIIAMAETQVNFAIQCIKKVLMNKDGLQYIEPTKEAQEEYMTQLRSRFTGASWLKSCTSWYKND